MTADSDSWSSVWLALRSLLWTVLLPGFFAGYVPWRFFGLDWPGLQVFSLASILGLLCIGLGAGLLAACIVEFARSGRGTLSPVDPPQHLVVRGLYRYVRNPMYLSVTAIVLGEALLTRSAALTAYWAIWFACANLFVIGYEEPSLRLRFGASYDGYTQQVGRWLPRFGSRIAKLLSAFGLLWCLGMSVRIWVTPIRSSGVSMQAWSTSSADGTVSSGARPVPVETSRRFADISRWGAVPLVVPVLLAALATWGAWRDKRLALGLSTAALLAFCVLAGFSIGTGYLWGGTAMLWALLIRLDAKPREAARQKKPAVKYDGTNGEAAQ